MERGECGADLGTDCMRSSNWNHGRCRNHARIIWGLRMTLRLVGQRLGDGERRVRQGAQGCVPGVVRRGWKSPENLAPDKSADAHLKGSCEQTHDRRETNYAATNLYICYRQISIQEASHQQISALGLLFCSFFLFIRCRFHHMFFIRLLFKTRFRYS